MNYNQDDSSSTSSLKYFNNVSLYLPHFTVNEIAFTLSDKQADVFHS